MRPSVLNTRAASRSRFRNWLRVAAPGTTLTYHEGFLAEDRWQPIYRPDLTVSHHTSVEPFHGLGELALEAAAKHNYVILTQKRLGDGHFAYRATRTSVPFNKEFGLDG